MENTRLFTSEAVSDGHPDKVCDVISDGILDAALEQDRYSRVAIETAVKGDDVYVFGEMTTNAEIDVCKVVRDALTSIGYDNPMWGFDPWRVNIIQNISEQSNEIAGGVDGDGENLGAGDQGIMFGYAVQETPEMMPLPITLARKITEAHRERRLVTRDHASQWLGPDAKSQVTIRYADGGTPVEIDTVVLSSLHADASIIPYNVVEEELHNMAMMAMAQPYASGLITPNTKFVINPAGPWTVGGPIADAGLTGRKIIVDTYGGAARHGGGAFSGKDPTKVDRSAAYAARHLAKTLCERLGRHRTEVQVSYAIGVPEPVSVHVYGMHESEINEVIAAEGIDLSPSGIINNLDLRRPVYQDTAQFGHFGHSHYSWEQI